jgi:hypothetical protein
MMRMSLALIAYLVLTANCQANMTAATYTEDGSSGPGLYSAIHEVKPISVFKPIHPDFVDMATLGWDKFHGNLVIQYPKSRFAVFMWQEDAQGNKMGILDSGTTELPGPWRASIDTRFWSGKWSEDIVAFGWSPNGEELLVMTGDVFNDGGVYWLDLMNRTAEKIGAGEVKKIDWVGRHVSIGKDRVGIPIAKPRGKFQETP